MLKIAILDAETFGDDVNLSGFNHFGEAKLFQSTSPEELIDRIRDRDIVVANKVVIDRATMKECKNLKLICVSATGVNNVDVSAAKDLGIAVTNVSGYGTKSIVQHTFALLFYIMEKIRYYNDYVKSGAYSKSRTFTCLDRPFHELHGKTYGIIGLGQIGRGVAEIASAFGAKPVYYSTTGKNFNSDYERLDLPRLLRISDVVSIHCPLNERTINLITGEQLKMMKSSAFLLNLARGGIVNEVDLADALDRGLIAGAGLDVLSKEPINADNPLLKIHYPDRLIITPHIAWTSIESRQNLVQGVIANIEAFEKGEKRNRIV